MQVSEYANVRRLPGQSDTLLEDRAEQLESRRDLAFGDRRLADGADDRDRVALLADVVRRRDRGNVDVCEKGRGLSAPEDGDCG